MTYEDGTIQDVIWRKLSFWKDPRGWLVELFRHDGVPKEYHPVMAYISMTEPGISRGPHEHVDQSDYFCFYGPSNFKVYLWDARPHSPTYGKRDIRVVGIDDPHALIVPPGVVHGYKNVGGVQGIVFNGANRLYKGWDRKEPVDEIRHEEHADSPFKMD